MSYIEHLRSTTALSVVSAIMMSGAATSVAAQDTDTEADLEEVVVTGSRIPRKDLVANSPVNVITGEEFRLGSFTEVEALLNTLPQVVSSNGASTNNPGNGQANVDLRNLGTQRTLVLVNGRRFVGAATNGVVDLNNIPAALIERVEVVTGGASAVYGSDAMAGVVNFITRRDFEGLATNTQYGITQEGDGERISADITMGVNTGDGRGNITLNANYLKRDQVLAGARDHSAVQFNELAGGAGLAPGGSTTIPQGRFNSNALPSIGGLDSFGNPIGSNGFLVTDDGQARAVVRPQDEYNFAPVNNLLLPLERYTFSGMGSYQITDGIRFFGEVTFANNTIERELAATPFSETGFQVDLRNPFITDAVRAVFAQIDQDGDNIVTTGVRRRTLEAGGRVSRDSRNLFRVVGGFDGELENGMAWELFYNYGRNENSQRQDGNIVISKFQQGLLVDPNNPTQCLDPSGGCVVLNPFGQGNLTQEMVDFIVTGATNLTQVEQQQVGGNIAGNIFELPAGEVGIALGAEYRKETAAFTPDTFLASGDIDGFNAGQPTAGSFDVKEIYAESIIPILSGVEGAEYLGLELGVRFSDYSTAGGVTSYKLGGEWRPFDELKFRGLYQRAVRAPNILELFQGQTNAFPGAQDLCNATANRSQAEADFCVNSLGVPASAIATFQQENAQIETLNGGNPDLFEETSDTWSVGFVYQPSQVPGLSFTADLYSIKVDNAIALFGGGLSPTINACRSDLSLNNEFCQVLTARRSDGQLEEVPLFRQNIAQRTAKGVDFRVDYGFDTDNYGDFSWFLAGSYLIEATTRSSPFVNAVNCDGTVGVRGTCGRANPEWRFVSRLTHTMDNLTTSLLYRYVGGVTDERINLAEANGDPIPTLFIPEIGAEHYVDLTFSYKLGENFTLYTTVNNLFDNDPPLIGRGAAGQFNTDAGTYDVLGRRFTFGVRTRF
ncbi:TonB-dependent receptor plug domain-containing protein [Kordiimonas aquimaris]|uniref:TonB-dependent receptor plug domain-containing protein n=1 Tax=Kordiimonas aquimaris TaxID=707591 RepID=UPI0021D1BA37|nr:TonB-dependent receptor [Kordiimonas aquimaris]